MVGQITRIISDLLGYYVYTMLLVFEEKETISAEAIKCMIRHKKIHIFLVGTMVKPLVFH